MRYLIDTQLTLWIPSGDARVSSKMLRLLEKDENEFLFSTASLWEIAIKRSLGKADFQIDPRGVRRQLQRAGYEELPVLGEHAMAVDGIPFIHKDPFDRLLIAQAMVEGITLLTSDATIARYQGPIRKV
jgi:PIN domain nuclease of toxin-antitoxin system